MKPKPPYYRQALRHTLQDPVDVALLEIAEVASLPNFSALALFCDEPRGKLIQIVKGKPTVTYSAKPANPAALFCLACDETLVRHLANHPKGRGLNTRWRCPDTNQTANFIYPVLWPDVFSDTYAAMWKTQRGGLRLVSLLVTPGGAACDKEFTASLNAQIGLAPGAPYYGIEQE